MSQRGSGAEDTFGLGYGPVVGATTGPTDSFHYYGKPRPAPFSSSFPSHAPSTAGKPVSVSESRSSEWMVNSGGPTTPTPPASTSFNLNPSAEPFKLAAASDTGSMIHAMGGVRIMRNHRSAGSAAWGAMVPPVHIDIPSVIHNSSTNLSTHTHHNHNHNHHSTGATAHSFIDYTAGSPHGSPIAFTNGGGGSGGVLAPPATAALNLHCRPPRTLPARTHAAAASQEDCSDRPQAVPHTRRYRMRMLPPPLSLEAHRAMWRMNNSTDPHARVLSSGELDQHPPEVEVQRQHRLGAYELVVRQWFAHVERLISNGLSPQTPLHRRCPSLSDVQAHLAAMTGVADKEATLAAWSVECTTWWENHTQAARQSRVGATKGGEPQGGITAKAADDASGWAVEVGGQSDHSTAGSPQGSSISLPQGAGEQQPQAPTGGELDITQLRLLLAELGTEVGSGSQ